MSSRILCLHGYGQNGIIFKKKLRALAKMLKEFEFDFIDAPHVIRSAAVPENGLPVRMWWHTNFDGTIQSDKNDGDGLEESISCVENHMTERGPFDGILGYSQGGALLAVIAALKQRAVFKPELNFVILVCAFRIDAPCFAQYYSDIVNVPSLHVIGESDDIIPQEKCEQLRSIFNKENAETIVHPGGHYVPSQSKYRTNYSSFIKKYSVSKNLSS